MEKENNIKEEIDITQEIEKFIINNENERVNYLVKFSDNFLYEHDNLNLDIIIEAKSRIEAYSKLINYIKEYDNDFIEVLNNEYCHFLEYDKKDFQKEMKLEKTNEEAIILLFLENIEHFEICEDIIIL